MRKIIDRTGCENTNNQGQKMKIIRCRGSMDIDVEFEDGTVLCNLACKEFFNGSIKNPNYPSVYGVGIYGIGDYVCKNNGHNTEEYTRWCGIIERCYSKRFQNQNHTYKDCILCPEWINFQVFAQWYYDNKWDDNIQFCVDKDILLKNNKLYSPDTCVLVDVRINSLFTKTNVNRGLYPIGVFYKKENRKFVAQCSILGEVKKQQKHIGLFSTPEEAFYAYKKFKESYIKQVADEYKAKYPNFPNRLYNAMYSYEVEITD